MNILDFKRKLLPLSGYMGDSGGGGGGAAPSDKTTSVVDLPDWSRGSAQRTLNKAEALTDINQNPYQTYGANRIAGFSPMQQRSMQAAANMRPSEQLGTATDLATAAGVGALGANYQGGQFSGGTFGQADANAYMNPYQQSVTDISKREAVRQSGMVGNQMAGQATQAGAFGGSRHAIQEAERQRNLGQQMGDIQAQGSNAAFQQAQAQFNADQARRMQAQQLGEQSRQYGAGLGMQGLQTALQGASQLGQLGQTQYGQQMGINQLQNQYGQQMQQQAQRPLDMAYQDFQNQQNYPYQQLGFMSDMIRGLPLGQQSTKSVYQAPPSALQTVGAAGMGLYGAKQLGMFGKEGGLMESYAGGGVTSQDNIEGILDKLSDQQLKQAKQTALARRDVEQANMIDAEMAERASIRGGLGGAFNQIPQEQQEEMMAGGGIVAFNGNNQSFVTDEQLQETLDELNPDEGGSGYSAQASRRAIAEADALDRLEDKGMSTEDYLTGLKSVNEALRTQAGKDTGYEKFARQLADLESSGEKRLNEGRGLSALAAIPEMLKGNNAVRGIGGAGGKFADVYGQYVNAANKEKLSLARMNYDLSDAKRKENLGFSKDSATAMDSLRKHKQDANRFAVEKAKAKGILLGKVGTINKPGKGVTPNFDINAQASIAADLKATTPMKKGETPEQYDARINAAAFRQILELKGTKDITSRSNVTSERDITPGGAEAGAKSDTVAAELAKQQEAAVVAVKKSIPYLKAMQQKDSAAMQKMEEDARTGVTSGFEKARKQVNPSAKPAAPTAQPLPANPIAANLKDGVVYSTPKGNGKWNAATQKFTSVP